MSPSPALMDAARYSFAERAASHMVHSAFGRNVRLPSGSDIHVTWRRLERSDTSPQITSISAPVRMIGQFSRFDSAGVSEENRSVVVEGFAKVWAESAALDAERAVRDELHGGENVIYAGGKSSRGEIGRDDRLTKDLLLDARTVLFRNDSRPVRAADERFVCIAHPDTQRSLFGGDAPSDFMDIRFYFTDLAKVHHRAGKDGLSVYGTLLFGEDAFGASDLNADDIRLTFRESEESIVTGYLLKLAYTRLNEAFLVRVEHATESSDYREYEEPPIPFIEPERQDKLWREGWK